MELPNPDEIPTTVAPVEQDETQAMINDSQTNTDNIIDDDPSNYIAIQLFQFLTI
jgi:hypothetical protein